MKTKTYLLLLALCFFVHCCTEEPDTLPPITTTGENTFGCLVDGEVFVADKAGIYDNHVYADVSENSLSIAGSSFKGNIYIQFWNNPFYGIGNYFLNDTIYKVGYFINNYNNEYYTSKQNIGELLITHFDTIHYIISGTFWFDAISKEGEIVKIRDGRFDIIY